MGKNSVERRYLRVVEPWGGGHTPFDTGFGNRLLHWDACYMLYMVSGGEHFLDIEQRYWLEFKYFDLPGTRTFDMRHSNEDIHAWMNSYDFDYKNDSITKLPCIGDEQVEEFLKTGKLDLPEPRYYFKFNWDYVGKILEKAVELDIPSGLKRMKPKFTTMHRNIQRMGNNCIGIHIRRGNGVYKSNTDYAELPQSVRENKYYFQFGDTIYKYWKNNVYKSLMKEILDIDKVKKFYISCDLLDEEYEYLKKELPGTIYTRKDIIDNLPKNITKGINFKDVEDKERVALESVVDMLCLSQCNYIVGAPHSTWTDAVRRMKPVPFSTISEPRDLILPQIERAIKNYTSIL